jgi:hypothetical protein
MHGGKKTRQRWAPCAGGSGGGDSSAVQRSLARDRRTVPTRASTETVVEPRTGSGTVNHWMAWDVEASRRNESRTP